TLIDDAVQVMRERSVRRIVIVQGTQPVGVVTLGDLAMERDPSSALADISSAPPQH
ncbi:MAG TPA: CBS domain-containing protein, partial [Myxococcota bacterium]|nr:CBS domain-containing protein [Myxococcota bacterium]